MVNDYELEAHFSQMFNPANFNFVFRYMSGWVDVFADAPEYALGKYYAQSKLFCFPRA